jgi:hypothetical protein
VYHGTGEGFWHSRNRPPGALLGANDFSDASIMAADLSEHTMTPIEEFAHAARSWARQTIIFTLQYGLAEVKDDAEQQAQLAALTEVSARTLNRMWARADSRSADLVQTVSHFVRLVLEWSSEHVSQPGNGQL